MQPLRRVRPNGPPQAYETYRMVSPRDLTVVAACQAVGCAAWHNGWDTVVDERTGLGMSQAAYIRSGQSGRTYREVGRNAAGLTVFRFECHQRCFTEHRTRREVFGVLAGDWRETNGLIRRHTRAVDFAEDMHDSMDRTWTKKAQG